MLYAPACRIRRSKESESLHPCNTPCTVTSSSKHGNQLNIYRIGTYLQTVVTLPVTAATAYCRIHCDSRQTRYQSGSHYLLLRE